MKCIASFSGGKDSCLALYRALEEGMEVLALITSYNEEEARSWFHGIPKDLLDQVAEKVSLPISYIKTRGDDYNEKFEEKLKEYKGLGAECCVFGDIDIEEHRAWCQERCDNTGLKAYFPLWKESRKEVAYAVVDLGFKPFINIIDATKLDEKFLGETLSRELLDQMQVTGVDICGERGEYHSFVFDGPLFESAVDFQQGDRVQRDDKIYIPLNPKE